LKYDNVVREKSNNFVVVTANDTTVDYKQVIKV